MKVTFWGVRGSIPVPGPDTLKYGGNSSCVSVNLNGGDPIIFDAGTGILRLGQKLMKESKPLHIHLLLSHGHMDHVHGFPFFAPAYIAKNRITVMGCAHTGRSVKELLRRQMGDIYFPVEYEGLPAKMDYIDYCGNHCNVADDKDCVEIHGAKIHSHGTNHPGGGITYRVQEKKKNLVYMTDNELMSESVDAFPFEEFVEFAAGADVLIADTQYSPEEYERTRGWGHSTYEDTARLAVEAGVKKLVLFHHDPDHNDKKVDWMEAKSRAAVKKLGGKCEVIAAREGLSIKI